MAMAVAGGDERCQGCSGHHSLIAVTSLILSPSALSQWQELRSLGESVVAGPAVVRQHAAEPNNAANDHAPADDDESSRFE
jgi:hypothetical protein